MVDEGKRPPIGPPIAPAVHSTFLSPSLITTKPLRMRRRLWEKGRDKGVFSDELRVDGTGNGLDRARLCPAGGTITGR